MNINEFKEGDIITRNEPMTYKHNGVADGSYTGTRLVFIGYDPASKVIMLVDDIHEDIDLSYARDSWDEGWQYYPVSLLEKARKFIKKNLTH